MIIQDPAIEFYAIKKKKQANNGAKDQPTDGQTPYLRARYETIDTKTAYSMEGFAFKNYK